MEQTERRTEPCSSYAEVPPIDAGRAGKGSMFSSPSKIEGGGGSMINCALCIMNYTLTKVLFQYCFITFHISTFAPIILIS